MSFRPLRWPIACMAMLAVSLSYAQTPLAGTLPLVEAKPLDVVMVEGIDRFALRELAAMRIERQRHWSSHYASADSLTKHFTASRLLLAKRIGAVGPREAARGIELIETTSQPALVAENEWFTIRAVRWPVLPGVNAEGLLVSPHQKPIARVVAIPDADWTPEMIVGLEPCATHFAASLAALGCEVLVPTLVDRESTYSRNESIQRRVDISHREFVYRHAFELGRHVIGYEVQKVLAAVDQFERHNQASDDLPIGVVGVGEGGLLAMHSAAIDTRIDGVVVSGYFDERDAVWQEPLYRNVWRQLAEFGDAEIVAMIAPRLVCIENSPDVPVVLAPRGERQKFAAPGEIRRPRPDSVAREWSVAQDYWRRHASVLPEKVDANKHLVAYESQSDPEPPLAQRIVTDFVHRLTGTVANDEVVSSEPDSWVSKDLRQDFSKQDRQERQVREMIDHTQRLLARCHRQREERLKSLDRSSVERWVASSESFRDEVHAELIGKLPQPTMPPRARTRAIIDEATHAGFEVVLDVYPDVIASGVLLVPKATLLGHKQRRPVVVCQHGLEGTPMDTIAGPGEKGYSSYKSYATELVKRGFIVYSPQNPYRGGDAFRTLQRKSNPLGRSLFSYIIPQHLVTLRWLASLPFVDAERIAFYGLSYGGKTAMRVPPLLAPSESEPGYCLSICSGDFNEWVVKNASTELPMSYVWTGEYEIYEWDMGHIANYAELAMLMTPRPFMVERGHHDGVATDEWVAWEYAKVRRHYNLLGIGDRTEIDFFDGPHTIHGRATFEFLHRHLDWPLP